MKIALLSTSRADESALAVAEKALAGAGHQTLRPFIRPGSLYDAAPGEILNQLERHRPDLVVLHGDRWDCLIAATACTVARVPIAHIGGGDATAGSYDDRFRNAITMLADWHLVSTVAAAQRLMALRTKASSIHVIGELAIDWLATADLGIEVKHNLGLGPYIIVNWQPETAAADMNRGLALIIEALPLLKGPYPIAKDYDVVFMNQNGDAGAMEAEKMIEAFQLTPRGKGVWFLSKGLPREEYAALMKHCCCMVGNSSSGLIEAPVFSRPFVLVGDRQKGRPISPNTAQFPTHLPAAALAMAIDVAAETGMLVHNGVRLEGNPYGDGKAGEKLVAAVAEIERSATP